MLILPALSSLYFSRVLRIFQPRPELQRIIGACEAAIRKSAQYSTTVIVLPFPEDWVPPNVSPSLARFKLSWESFVALPEEAWKTLLMYCRLCFFRESPFFLALEARTLTYVSKAESYPDSMPDPGSGERSVDTHCGVCSLVSCGIVYLVRFDSMRSMYRAPHWAGVCLRCPLSPTVTSTHLHQQEAPKTESSSQ